MKSNNSSYLVGILTVSDRAARGEYADESGILLSEIIKDNTNWQISRREIIPDEMERISEILIDWCSANLGLILTTGGTGFSARDVTPEATKSVIDREAPGIVEALRSHSLKITRHAMLSRAVSGIRGKTLIINLPGNPKAVQENMDFLLPVLPHALELLADTKSGDEQHRSI